MATVKIYLEGNETVEQAEEVLFKALTQKQELDPKESFTDPAMIDVQEVLIKAQGEIYQRMLNRIFDVLDEEFQEG